MDSVPKVGKPTEHDRPLTNSELFSSAKVLAEAAQASFGNEKDKIDKAKVAGAADDILEAASKYGKLGEKGLGQYVDKAQTYLHQYQSNSQNTTSAPSTTGSGHTAPVEKKESSAPPTGGDGDKFGGALKMAQGFFK